MAKPLAVLIVIVLILAGAAMVLFALSSHSSLAFDPAPMTIGAATPIGVRIANQHAVRAVIMRIEQDGNSVILDQETKPATRFTFWRTHAGPEIIHFIVGKDRASHLKEGKARVIVEVQSNDLRALTETIAIDTDVVLRPPSITTDGFQHYINQGGSEFAILTPAGSW